MKALSWCCLLLSSASLLGSTLGPAEDFNLFVFSDYTAHNSDVQGRVAVGGNAHITSTSLNRLMVPGSDGLLVQGNLTAQNGQLYSGDARVGGTAGLSNFNILPPGVLTGGGIPSDFFTNAQSLLQARADYYFSLPPSGSTGYWFGAIVLSGSDFASNIFQVDGAALASATGLTINAPVGSSVVVNVTGSANSMQNLEFFLATGLKPNNVLFNFANTTDLLLSGVGVQGSILAPRASVDFNNGQLNGTLVAYLAQGNGEYHWQQHSGIPSDNPSQVPEPGAFSLVLLGLGGAAYYRRRATRKQRNRRPTCEN